MGLFALIGVTAEPTGRTADDRARDDYSNYGQS